MATSSAPGAIPSPSELTALHRVLYDGLASIYDERVEELRPVVSHTLNTLLLPRLPLRARCLDVGCGAGLVSQLLVQAGHRAVGVDLSAGMVIAAASRAPQASFVVGDYLTTRFDAPLDAISAFAFIHLFPAAQAQAVLEKMHADLAVGGLLLIGTTAASAEREGFEPKTDYPGAPARFRRHWTPGGFRAALRQAGFEILEELRHPDPFGKDWLDVIARRSKAGRGDGRAGGIVNRWSASPSSSGTTTSTDAGGWTPSSPSSRSRGAA